MIKRLLVLCFFISFLTTLKAQPYHNEWINYSQSYYKIKIAQNGIYRIDSTTLANAGIPIASINPKNFQLFNNGKEQYIFVQGEIDNIFNGTDFIEFYGKKNDGLLDTALYINTPFLPNPYYSLINDTAVYFLTWNSSTSNYRMQVENDTTFSLYSPTAYFFKEEIKSFNSDYFAGETDAVGRTDSRYTKSEGWFDANVFYLGGNNQYLNLINTNNRFTFGPKALFKSVVVGASQAQNLIALGQNDHHLTIEYRGASGSYSTIKDTAFKGYASNRFIDSIPTSLLGNTYTDFKYSSVADPAFTSNRTTVSYIYLKYPHTLDLEGKQKFDIYLPDNTSQTKSFLNISNFNATGTVRFFDLSNNKRIDVVQAGANYNVLVPNTGSEKKCYITSDANIINITNLIPVSPSAQFANYLAQAADSVFIIITHKSLMNEALLYKQYRSINAFGGNHNVVIADIDELYDQFAHGIVKSPLSIRRFSEYLIDNYPSPPQNLFLLGKSIHMYLCRNTPANYNLCLVPSFGNPSSDLLLTAEINGLGIVPSIPTGRLAARVPADVLTYLNKVEDYENRTTNPVDEWMKYGLNFGGGGTIGEQTQLRNYLTEYKRIFQDTLYGGKIIKEFYKTTSSPIPIAISDTLETLIETGVSILNFFGHSSGNSFDISIDQITQYNPIIGHYPFMISNGCYSGDLHEDDTKISEEFVFAQNKGVIGYLGSIGKGVSYALDIYTKELYNQMCLYNYGNGIGSSIKKTINTIQGSAAGDALVRATCYEMTLHADPSLKLNAQKKPDYKITNSNVIVDLSDGVDSFAIHVIRINLGKATKDSIFDKLTRYFPNGDSVIYYKKTRTPKFKDTITYKIPYEYERSVGLNRVKVQLDYYNNVDELNEFNNTTNPDVTFQITGNDIIPVYPYKFAIIPTDTITLKASTVNALATARNYIFQIDTTDTFDSPFMKQTVVNAPGGVVKWNANITNGFNFTDSTVYFWRVSPDSVSPTSGYLWRESSFQYIQNRKGWEQAHLFQFKEDGYQYVKLNRVTREFDFANDVIDIFCQTGIFPYTNWYDILYKINGSSVSVWTCLFPRSGFTFAIFNAATGVSETSYLVGGGLGQYGDYHCVSNSYQAFEFFDDTPAWRDTLADFLNGLPPGTRVLGFSEMYGQYSQYEPYVNNAFKDIGVNDMLSLQDSTPTIIWGIKGAAPGTATEVVGTSITSTINLSTSFPTSWNEGYIASPIIGPAQSWGSLHWRQHTNDGTYTEDSIVVRVIGIDNAGNEAVLANFPKDSIDILNLSAYVNVTQYPNIRLVAYMKDDSLHTPPQMERWQVIYAPVPEAALNPPLGYNINNSQLQEGDSLRIRLPIQNIGDVDFTDSLLVSYWIEDANRNNHALPDKIKKKPFIPNEVIIDTIAVSTENYGGANALWVEVNQINKPKSQLEQYHFNNIVRIPFTVDIDKINPLLDVTFDGVHILNNDIISAKPNILVKLKDENQFLALNDTTDFKVFLKTPTTAIAQRIWFLNTLTFTEAVLPNNSCKINYTPYLQQDGIYQLIVQAKDKSDNQSGSIDYKINFEVINKSTITEVMNYPNPFSTSTKFVFTLTGEVVPTTFKIQIMTITGKVVKEIYQDEIGPIHIGRNITEYAWDGKDEFGDRLANGVYLYRVITKISGEDIEKRETSADQYFKKGWGKMYLMR